MYYEQGKVLLHIGCMSVLQLQTMYSYINERIFKGMKAKYAHPSSKSHNTFSHLHTLLFHHLFQELKHHIICQRHNPYSAQKGRNKYDKCNKKRAYCKDKDGSSRNVFDSAYAFIKFTRTCVITQNFYSSVHEFSRNNEGAK